MALEKRNVSIRVGAGLAEDVDAFLLETPAALELRNARFPRTGSVGKRHGHEALATSGSHSGAVGQGTVVEQQGALFQTHPDGTLQLDEVADFWRALNISAPRPSRVLTDPLVRVNGTIESPDCAIIGDLLLAVWEDQSIESVSYAFFHADTLVQLSPPRSFSGTFEGPRVLALDTKFVIVAKDTSNDDATAWDYDPIAGDYDIDDSPVTLQDVGGTPWDVCRNATASNFTLMRWFGGGTQFFEYTNAVAATGIFAQTPGSFRGRSVTYNSGNDKIVCASDDGYLAHFDADYSPSTVTVTSQLIVPGLATNEVRESYVGQRDNLGGMWFVISGVDDLGGSQFLNYLVMRRITGSFTTSGAQAVHSGRLAARPAYMGDSVGDTLFAIWNDGSVPVMYFAKAAFDEESAARFVVVGTALQDSIDKSVDGHAITGGTNSHLGHLPAYGASHYALFTTLVEDRSSATSVPMYKRRQADLVRVTTETPPPQRTVTAQSLRLLADGCGVTCLDGARHGELTPPPVPTLIQKTDDFESSIQMSNDTAPYADPAGTDPAYFHIFRVLWRWVDAQGNVHRGAPSDEYVSFSKTTLDTGDGDAGDGGDEARRIIVPKPVTALDGLRGAKLELEVYQTWGAAADTPDSEDDWHFAGTVRPIEHPDHPSGLYFVVAWLNTVPNAYTFNVLNNATLIANEALYTVSELPALPPPPFLDIASTQNRLWGLSAENRLEVWPSKPIATGFAPEFAAELVVRIPHEGGDCVAIAALSDKVVVMKERQLYALFGEPGSASGDGSTLQRPRLIPSDAGCVNARSVVDCGSRGVAFQSERGIVLLTPALTIEPIGDAVRDSLSTSTITSAVLVPSESEVRWTLDNDTALVWNYKLGVWSVWDLDASSACVWNGLFTFLTSANAPRRETPGAWDEGASDALVVGTPWLTLAGKQGLQRINRAIALLRHYSGGLSLEVAYDFDEGAPGEQHAWVEATLSPLAPCQVSVDPHDAKCEAIRFVFTEIGGAPTGGDPKPPPSSGRGFELVGLDVIVGVKRGNYRHKQADAGKG